MVTAVSLWKLSLQIINIVSSIYRKFLSYLNFLGNFVMVISFVGLNYFKQILLDAYTDICFTFNFLVTVTTNSYRYIKSLILNLVINNIVPMMIQFNQIVNININKIINFIINCYITMKLIIGTFCYKVN